LAVTATPYLSDGEPIAGDAERAPGGPLSGKVGAAEARPSALGKFLFAGETKLYIRGATYGTFAPAADGQLYPTATVVAQDFAQMAANGFNAVRTYTVPPRWLLDLAAESGLFVMVGIAWEQHVDFLNERRRARAIEGRIRAGVAACAGHPAVLSYSVGNEIPSQMVRWLGRRPVERFIGRLYSAAKSEDPGGLVTYVNYPSTEYLQLPFLDLACFNVYLEAPTALDAYLARLHNLAGDRPLLMAEVGLDSRRHGERKQAASLDWQIRTALGSGCAGAFVFAWTDEWYVSYLSDAPAADGVEIDDWDFGLTDRDRRPKPALDTVRRAFDDAPFQLSHWPRISVVVCTHNGERTLAQCLDGLRELDYPDFEVIVVDDGSTDSTAKIAAASGFRLISTPNQGLGTARNVGLHAAEGEIVAYLDDDARPDPHWLSYLAATFARENYASVGGPNVPPSGSPALARCIAAAPGGPTHVLVSDREAEHIPGCNMAFRKDALAKVGGFDPQFRVAGDDVDVCWRLLAAGERIGFNPAALVWHSPRGSIRGYWRQQRGYGSAEAMLERKWPDKYSTDGHARWSGRLYRGGPIPSLRRSRVNYGTWGAELFQSLYSPGGGAPSSLFAPPAGPLWVAALALLSALGLFWTPLLIALPALLAVLAIAIVLAGARAAPAFSSAPHLPRHRRLARYTVVTLLHLIQPVARTRGRISGPPRHDRARAPRFAVPQARAIKVWSELWRSAEKRLATIEAQLGAAGAIVSRGGAYDRWDLQARYGLLGAVRIRMGIEEHGAGRQLVRFELSPRYSRTAIALIALFTAIAYLAWQHHAYAAAGLLGAAAVVLGAHALRLAGNAMGTALREVQGSNYGALAVRRDQRKLELEET
jgi:O-antigen biosynthesis protein